MRVGVRRVRDSAEDRRQSAATASLSTRALARPTVFAEFAAYIAIVIILLSRASGRPLLSARRSKGDEMKRREFLALAAGAAAWPVAASGQTNDYPTRTVRIVIGFGAGGGTDTVARIVAQKLQETLGGTFLVENKPGAGGRLAPDTVAKSTPDGYTLLGAAPGAMTVGTAIWPNIPYDIFKDFAPISMIADYPMLVLVNKIHPAQNIARAGDVAEGQSRQGELSDAVAGVHAADRALQDQDRRARARRSPTAAATSRSPACSADRPRSVSSRRRWPCRSSAPGNLRALAVTVRAAHSRASRRADARRGRRAGRGGAEPGLA